MHCHWRNYNGLIMWCASKLNNPQMTADPKVSDFNTHRHFFLEVVTLACSEYVLFIASQPGAETLDDPAAFIHKASANMDLAWVCNFLFDAGFHTLEFLQSVRSNDSHKLDLLWREFYASARCDAAHKTQYVPMAIMRVFWGCAPQQPYAPHT